jgi:FkbM family methyltransferase
MDHYIRICKKILTSRNHFNRAKLLFTYAGLIFRSIYFHKIGIKSSTGSLKHRLNILGFRVESFSYPQIINLLEEIFIYDVYSSEIKELHPYIIDCGSNIGMSVLYFKSQYPGAKILAFEPDHETFQLLSENVSVNNLDGVQLLNVALSDQDSEVQLFAKPVPGSLTMSLFKSEEKTQMKSVIAKKLSGYVNAKVDLLKIDVEGSEIKILRDLVESDKIKMIDQMIIEYHPAITGKPVESFIKFLESINFTCTFDADTIHPGATEVLIRARRS